MITRPQLLTLASLSLALACTTKQSASQNPDAGKYDDYYSDKGDGGAGGATTDEGGAKPAPRGVSGTKGAGERKGVAKALIAKRPVVQGGLKLRRPVKPPTDTGELTLTGFVPTDAAPGSVIEVFGSGFAKKATGNTVMIGGKKQKVLEVAEDHLVVQVGDASGPVEVFKGTKRTTKPGMSAKSAGAFNALPADEAFGKPRKDVHHGLVGSVFDLGKEVTELPNFGEVGSPIAIIAVPNLDIASTQWKSGFTGPSGKVAQWFGIHFRGSLNVTEKGSYTLCVASGDGTQLYLDENLVVDNDGVHDTAEKCETLTIEPGEYQFDLLYFQGAVGELGLRVTWAKDGGEKAPIPAESLFPPEDIASLARK